MVNHTWSHYSITQSADKARYEVATAKQQLQDHAGQNVNTFVYPYGAVNSSAIAVLQQEGVTGAFSEIGGHWQCDSFIMALHRTRIGNAPLSYYGL
jgi:peptidoglycan/xylan/chitin deacetylase (PgdA/CDA1 family)